MKHFLFYLSEDDAGKVLRCYQRDIARAIHAQMLEHFREDATGYEVKVSKGFTELKGSAYTQKAEQPLADYRVSPPDLGKIEQYLFGPFKRCLFHVQKFDSDPERRLAVILERDALKWIRPAKGQIEMEYRQGMEHLEYVPDFIVETDETKLMLETKAKNAMSDADVIAKKDVAVTWCKNASAHAATYGGKPWRYALIPDTAIAENMTLKGLVQKYGA